MKISRADRLVVEDSDGLTFRFVQSPNFFPGTVRHKYLIIHASEGPHLEAAIQTFLSVSGGKSAHLILGRDGKEVVQMLDFDRIAQHAHGFFNTRSIGIELDNTGLLVEDPSVQHHFSHVSQFQPGDYIYGVALNDLGTTPVKLRPWLRYSQEQMEALVQIARLLVERYGLEIVGHEEINSGKLDPGPAFPMAKFKEIVSGKHDRRVFNNEIGADLELRTGPGMIYPPLPGGRLAAGTPVVISSDHNGWARVEVMAEVEGNRWLVGWMPLDSISASLATPFVKDHKLFASDGRQYQFISPHPNNFDANRKLIAPKYLIIHTTDAIAVESTINSFRDEKHGASAHLVIGREGRVVQFVDFDTVAYHCGVSYWEEDVNLNDFSIGIELDNAGFLSHTDGVWKWKTTVIPDDDVTEIRHWKENSPRGWHNFTEIQLGVLREIVKVLSEQYGIRIVLGHDTILLPDRADPGPLFPMPDFQTLVSGQPGVQIKVYQTSSRGKTDIYKVQRSKPPIIAYPKPPDLNHPKHSGALPARTKINVLDIQDDWTMVKVKAESGPFRGTEGWIKSGAVGNPEGNPKTTRESEYFKVHPRDRNRAPWSLLRQSPLLPDTRLRVEKFEDGFALVASLEPVNQKFIEGWVRDDAIHLVGQEQLIYPPVMKLRRKRRGSG